MAVEAADLLQPKGDISPSWFPSLDAEGISTLLTAYIEDAETKIPATVTGDDVDSATRAWAMLRAVRNVLMRLANTPASSTLEGQGSQTITSEQIRTFKDLAIRYETDFNTITVDASPGPEETPSQSIENAYRW